MNFITRPSRAFLYLAVAVLAAPVFAQQDVPKVADQEPQTQTPPSESTTPTTPAPGQEQEPPGGKRVFGVLPNYRTADASQEGITIPSSVKFKIAAKDSFDYPLVLLSGAFAGLSQLTNSDPSFGQGLKGYAHRLATNYADQAMGNIFTEGLFPVLLHQDPRYFRKATGKKWSRAGYAVTRVFICDSDSGHKQFNYSEWLGNASAVAISNFYYPDNRTAADNAGKLLEQVGTDALSQVLKEFWPDIKQHVFHRGNGN